VGDGSCTSFLAVSPSLYARIVTAMRAADLAEPEEALKPLERMDLPEALHRGEALRAAAPQGSWTLRMVVSGPASGLKHVARVAGAKANEVLILPFPRRDGIRFWQACYGTYPSSAAAAKAWLRCGWRARRRWRDVSHIVLWHVRLILPRRVAGSVGIRCVVGAARRRTWGLMRRH